MASHLRRTTDSATDAVNAPTHADSHAARAGATTDAHDVTSANDGAAPAGTALAAARHARHAAAAEHGTSASVTGAFQRLDPSVTGSFAVLSDADLHPIDTPAVADEAAPRPIGVDPSVTGSFERITADSLTRVSSTADGATAIDAAASAAATRRMRGADRPALRRRATTSEQPPLSKRVLAVLVLVAVIIVVVGVSFVRRALTRGGAPDAAEGGEITQVAPTDAITVANTSYSIVDNDDGTHALYAQGAGGTAVAVATLNGDPAQILTYGGSIIVPESYSDGTWDIIAYTPGGDAIATQVVGGDGAPVHGSGSITEATLDGSELVIVDSSGATTRVSLGA